MSLSHFVQENDLYAERLKAFHDVSDYMDVGVKWIKDEFPSIIQRSRSETEPYRVLAVGTGNGKPQEETLLEVLSTLDINVIYIVVEPRGEALTEFRTSAESKYRNVKFQWFQTTYEDFQRNEWIKNGRHKYNLIHFFYSLHYIASTFESLTNTIDICYRNMIKDGSAIVSFLGNECGKQIYIFKLGFAATSHLELYRHPNVVGKVADSKGWENEVFKLNWQIDLSDCFVENSIKGGLILDTLAQETHFRQKTGKENLEKVLKFLKDQCDVKEDGRMIVYPLLLDLNVIWKE